MLIGASGSGKSVFAKQILDHALATGAADWAFIYDHKDPVPNFEGTVRRDVADLVARPPGEGDSPVVVFHSDGPGDPDEVAEAALNLSPEKVIIDIDETFPDAVTDGGQQFKSGQGGPLGRALRAGRSRGTSIMLCTQMPQYMPSVATDLCEAVVWFRMQGRSLGYVEREKRLPPDALARVAQLKTREQSEFLLVVEGTWDGKVYGPT